MINMYLLWDILFYMAGGGHANFTVRYVHGVFHCELFYFCLYVCKSVILVQSVLIHFFIGEIYWLHWILVVGGYFGLPLNG